MEMAKHVWETVESPGPEIEDPGPEPERSSIGFTTYTDWLRRSSKRKEWLANHRRYELATHLKSLYEIAEPAALIKAVIEIGSLLLEG
jgi:hypothetical protein